MNISEIVVAIDAQIAQLEKAKALLGSVSPIVKRKPGHPAKVSAPRKATSFSPAEFTEKPAKRRTMSAEGRAKIAAAQKLRWAKSKRAEKKLAREAATSSAKKTAAKNTAATPAS